VTRTWLAAVLLVLLLPAVVVANASTWALRTVVDDAAFTATVGRTLDTPSLRQELADRATSAVVTAISRVEGRLQVVVTVLGLGGDATRERLEAALQPRIEAALGDERVHDVRDRIVAAVHRALIRGLDGESEYVYVAGDEVVLDLEPLVERVAVVVDSRLPAAGITDLASADTRIVLAEAEAFETASDALDWMEALRIVIPLVVVIAILAVVGLAHRRTRALGIVGLAIMTAGLVSLAAAWFGGSVVGGVPADPTLGVIAEDVYGSFVSLLVAQSLLLVLAGGLLAVVAFILVRRRRGRRSSAVGYR
jgi:hypothetical protein